MGNVVSQKLFKLEPSFFFFLFTPDRNRPNSVSHVLATMALHLKLLKEWSISTPSGAVPTTLSAHPLNLDQKNQDSAS